MVSTKTKKQAIVSGKEFGKALFANRTQTTVNLGITSQAVTKKATGIVENETPSSVANNNATKQYMGTCKLERKAVEQFYPETTDIPKMRVTRLEPILEYPVDSNVNPVMGKWNSSKDYWTGWESNYPHTLQHCYNLVTEGLNNLKSNKITNNTLREYINLATEINELLEELLGKTLILNEDYLEDFFMDEEDEDILSSSSIASLAFL